MTNTRNFEGKFEREAKGKESLPEAEGGGVVSKSLISIFQHGIVGCLSKMPTYSRFAQNGTQLY